MALVDTCASSLSRESGIEGGDVLNGEVTLIASVPC